MAAISSVLIIDDEEGARRTLVDIFQVEKVPHICAVATAEEALTIIEKEPFALIVCDYFLPCMNGLGFMGRLRLKGNNTPILLISGVPDKTEVIRASAQLKTAFLAKPFTPAQLMGSVENLINA